MKKILMVMTAGVLSSVSVPAVSSSVVSIHTQNIQAKEVTITPFSSNTSLDYPWLNFNISYSTLGVSNYNQLKQSYSNINFENFVVKVGTSNRPQDPIVVSGVNVGVAGIPDGEGPRATLSQGIVTVNGENYSYKFDQIVSAYLNGLTFRYCLATEDITTGNPGSAFGFMSTGSVISLS